MRRALDQYTNSSAKVIASECSEAHIANWIEDAQADLAAMHAALRCGLDLISKESGWGTWPRMEGSEIYSDADLFERVALAAITENSQAAKR